MTRLLPIAALGLAACAPTPPGDTPPTPPTAGLCDAGKVQDVIGKAALTVQADAQARSGARTIRVHKRGDPVTMDLREDRLNLVTDDAGNVVEAKCG